jgi:hypothetical protein
MFFRNNMPNDNKLSECLRDSPNSAAYCCQCNWDTIVDDEDKSLGGSGGGGIQWACAGHAIAK